MAFEVEVKYAIESPEATASELELLGARFDPPADQSDRYYGHPCRNFAETDEALRIRSTPSGHFVTYKGPKLDARTKTRREIELPIGVDADAPSRFGALLEALGFRPVATVLKQRREATLDWQNQPLVLALDRVDGLGAFLEIETIATADNLDGSRETILHLASALGLGHSERRSYLELLLDPA